MTSPARKQRAKEMKLSQIGLILAFGNYAFKIKIGIFWNIYSFESHFVTIYLGKIIISTMLAEFLIHNKFWFFFVHYSVHSYSST